MMLDNNKLIILLVAVAISIGSLSMYNLTVLIEAQNQTQSNLVDDITELTMTITTIAIPAVVALVTGVLGLIAAITGNKKAKEAAEIAKAGGLVAVTYGQKINDVVHKLNPLLTASFETLPAETKAKLNAAGVTVNEWNAIAIASAAQMNQLRERIPPNIFAKIDPNVLPLTREQDVLDGLVGNVSTTTSSSARSVVGKK